MGKANLKRLQCAESLGSCPGAFLKCIPSVLVERIQQIYVGWPPAQRYEDAGKCVTHGDKRALYPLAFPVVAPHKTFVVEESDILYGVPKVSRRYNADG